MAFFRMISVLLAVVGFGALATDSERGHQQTLRGGESLGFGASECNNVRLGDYGAKEYFQDYQTHASTPPSQIYASAPVKKKKFPDVAYKGYPTTWYNQPSVKMMGGAFDSDKCNECIHWSKTGESPAYGETPQTTTHGMIMKKKFSQCRYVCHDTDGCKCRMLVKGMEDDFTEANYETYADRSVYIEGKYTDKKGYTNYMARWPKKDGFRTYQPVCKGDFPHYPPLPNAEKFYTQAFKNKFTRPDQRARNGVVKKDDDDDRETIEVGPYQDS